MIGVIVIFCVAASSPCWAHLVSWVGESNGGRVGGGRRVAFGHGSVKSLASGPGSVRKPAFWEAEQLFRRLAEGDGGHGPGNSGSFCSRELVGKMYKSIYVDAFDAFQESEGRECDPSSKDLGEVDMLMGRMGVDFDEWRMSIRKPRDAWDFPNGVKGSVFKVGGKAKVPAPIDGVMPRYIR